MLVALELNTRIFMYGWNHLCADIGLEKVVHLVAGDVLMFRGDLIHCDAEYVVEKLRIHTYLDVDGVERRRNETTTTPVIDDMEHYDGVNRYQERKPR